MSDVTTHEHEYDGPPDQGVVALCVDRKCVHLVIGTGTGWREPTPTESTAITIRMMEDLIIADTMMLIHGKEAGMAKARYFLGMTGAV